MYNSRGRQSNPNVSLGEDEKNTISHIILDSYAADALVKYADNLGEQLKQENLKAGQIRAIFDEVRQIEAVWLQDEEKALYKVHLLKPKLAYRAARSADGVPRLKEVLTLAIDHIVEDPQQAKDRFHRFTQFFEAIIAYHKAHGGED
jgi:CRISPR-associated protein Csm2